MDRDNLTRQRRIKCDNGSKAELALFVSDDGDVFVHMINEDHTNSDSIRLCTYGGGGRQLRTLSLLRQIVGVSRDEERYLAPTKDAVIEQIRHVQGAFEQSSLTLRQKALFGELKRLVARGDLYMSEEEEPNE